MKTTGLSNMSNIAMLIVIPSPVLFSLHHSSCIPRDKKKLRNTMPLNSCTSLTEEAWSYPRSEIGVRTVFNIIVTNLIVTIVY